MGEIANIPVMGGSNAQEGRVKKDLLPLYWSRLCTAQCLPEVGQNNITFLDTHSSAVHLLDCYPLGVYTL